MIFETINISCISWCVCMYEFTQDFTCMYDVRSVCVHVLLVYMYVQYVCIY